MAALAPNVLKMVRRLGRSVGPPGPAAPADAMAASGWHASDDAVADFVALFGVLCLGKVADPPPQARTAVDPAVSAPTFSTSPFSAFYNLFTSSTSRTPVPAILTDPAPGLFWTRTCPARGPSGGSRAFAPGDAPLCNDVGSLNSGHRCGHQRCRLAASYVLGVNRYVQHLQIDVYGNQPVGQLQNSRCVSTGPVLGHHHITRT